VSGVPLAGGRRLQDTCQLGADLDTDDPSGIFSITSVPFHTYPKFVVQAGRVMSRRR
jgi:hypothetical protein